jgi:hypothetical protein
MSAEFGRRTSAYFKLKNASTRNDGKGNNEQTWLAPTAFGASSFLRPSSFELRHFHHPTLRRANKAAKPKPSRLVALK